MSNRLVVRTLRFVARLFHGPSASIPFVCVLALSAGMANREVSAQAIYRITPLGHLPGCASEAPVAYGFNDADEVTGQACKTNSETHAFLWRNNGRPMVDLGPDKPHSYSVGYGINASGMVTGQAQDSTGIYAFVSSGSGAPLTVIPNDLGGSGEHDTAGFAINDSGQVTGIAAASDGTEHVFLWKRGAPMRDLGVLNAADGFDYASGNAINAAGQIAGTSGYAEFPFAYAFVWQNDGRPLRQLGTLGGGTTTACCINASGQVAGSSDTGPASRPHAFLWRTNGKGILSLGTLGGAESISNALNDSGQVVGFSDTLRFLEPHAFVWLNNRTPMKDLGTLGGTFSSANAINNGGEVTGTANLKGDAVGHAFVWRNGGGAIADLNSLIDSTDPLKPFVTLTNGVFINTSGNILAEGTDSRTGSGLYLLQRSR
jgi:probable HAF family extracellular repeat protein